MASPKSRGPARREPLSTVPILPQERGYGTCARLPETHFPGVIWSACGLLHASNRVVDENVCTPGPRIAVRRRS